MLVNRVPGLPIEPPFDGQMGRVCITEILQRGSAGPLGSRSRGRSSAIALTPPPISRIASREGAEVEVAQLDLHGSDDRPASNP